MTDGATVKVSQGSIQGTTGNSLSGDPFYKFFGIPFAKAPVGQFRFKDPEPAESWEGVKDCTKVGDICFQRNEITKGLEGSENCLHLNIYTRELPNEQNTRLKPVMVWIHGGGFIICSNDPSLFGPENLMTEDIVLVVPNYRLGLLGFLRVKDDSGSATGNMGFKDQCAALRWVKDNIAHFGGDPNNVTLFGESAGAAGVHYQILSKQSSGLFHKAIMESGSSMMYWTEPNDHCATEIAQIIDPNVQNESQALDVLRNAPLDKLMEAQEKYSAAQKCEWIPWPVLETPSDKAFISKRPIDIIQSGEYNKVPMIMGYNDQEGLHLLIKRKLFNDTREFRVSEKLPYDVEDQQKKNQLVEKMERFYFDGPNRQEGEFCLDCDYFFLAGIAAAAHNHVQNSPHPVYFYKMTVDTKLNWFKWLTGFQDYPGACHADEFGYLWKTEISPEIIPGTIEEIALKRFIKLWTNFAKYGNPTPDFHEFGLTWDVVNKEVLNFKVLNIGKELRMENNPDRRRLELWREIYQANPLYSKYL